MNTFYRDPLVIDLFVARYGAGSISSLLGFVVMAQLYAQGQALAVDLLKTHVI